MDIATRFEHAVMVAEAFPSFPEFCRAGMQFLGFDLTLMQEDIAKYMQEGPRLRMVMAQRGEAKSTIAALYAVWRIVRDPRTNVLIVSAGGTQASQVATLVTRVIMHWDILEYLRPDRQAGDKTAGDEMDVHWSLKGVDKTPSVACVGITANLQGKRAHVLIPDDIETTKNGLTAGQRELLKTLSKEFSSICTHGDILYLGTPQTKDSIYNDLPGRGFDVRIWPGRYPTPTERENYGSRLAPFVALPLDFMPHLGTGGGLDGTRGQPADPGRYDEDALIEKETDQGPEGFQLQYMLDTSLSDAARAQLKLSDLVFADFESDMLPDMVIHRATPEYQIDLNEFYGPQFPGGQLTKIYRGLVPQTAKWVPRPEGTMIIDPAGGGGDELAYSITTAVGTLIHWLDCGGWRSGLTDPIAQKIADLCGEFNVKRIVVESNMGHGLFETNLIGAFVSLYSNPDKAIQKKYEYLKEVGVVGEYATTQKERRIIDNTVGALQRHRIVVHKRVVESDKKYNQAYGAEARAVRSVFYQMANITTDRNSLPKDDRLDAAAGSFQIQRAALAADAEAEREAKRLEEVQQHMANPMGYSDSEWSQQQQRGRRTNARARRNRR
ncbi:putative DNA packaging protein [Achromobacter phage vB_AxyP_19-32_Axy21]|uniref:Putative DNA packaging protein n=1 Tax=Achromobacter phage vB_AxyP_19-32_Axy21 TaxID=2591045 RepID=A0A514CVR3_9CAUD|nr:putative DNA packaging protein [Achromobacter phage vB_AxyP_19-32_Axy21]